MSFTKSTVLAAVLFVTSIVAAPRGHGLAHRMSQRAAGTRLAVPVKYVEGAESTNITNADIFYSNNWSGAVLTSPPSGETFSKVAGSFIVPTPSAPEGAESGTAYSASAWVGIDGDTYGGAILQTGVDFSITDGVISYNSWYEWYPDYAYDFSGLDISAGDTITVTVEAYSLSDGTATISSSNGQSVSQYLTAPSSSSNLAGVNAEWIVEDYTEDNSLVAICDFGTVVFFGATACTSEGDVGLDGAGIIDLQSSSGTTITNVTINDSATVTVVYTGP